VRTVAHISDLHFGRHSGAIVEALLTCLGEMKPDLVAVSGDLTQRAQLSEFAEAKAFLDRTPFPLLVIPGNHDIPLYDALARLLRPFARYNSFMSSAGISEAFFADEEIAVLGLNTVRRSTWKNGRVSLAQVAEISRFFGKVDRSLFKVVVTHHPLELPRGLAPVDLAGRARLALQAVAAAGVHLLLSGHYHRAASGGTDAEVAGGGHLLVVHAGTAVSRRTRGTDGDSFNLIHIDPPRLTVSVMVHVENSGFRERAVAIYRLEKDRWLREA
jgi:3',5'-cyclic AMP phosphodiesterase CpdA